MITDDQPQDTTSNESTSPAPASAPAPAEATPAAAEGTAPSNAGASDSAATPAPSESPAPADASVTTPAPAEGTESPAPATGEGAAPAPAPETPAAPPAADTSHEADDKPKTQADWDRIGRETRERHLREAAEREAAEEKAAQEAAVTQTTTDAPAPAPAAPAVASADPDMLALQRDLSNYTAQMMPAIRVPPGVGPAMQLTLYRAVMRVAGIKGDKFTPLWTAILAYAYEHRNDLWSERYINRFISDMNIPIVDIRNFEKLRHLISMTADPQSRAVAVKNIDFQTLMRFMPNPQVQQNLLGFYTAV